VIVEEGSDKVGVDRGMPSFHMSAIEPREPAQIRGSFDGSRRRSTSFKKPVKLDNDDNKSYLSSNSQLKYQGHKSLLEEALKKEMASRKRKKSVRKLRQEDRMGS